MEINVVLNLKVRCYWEQIKDTEIVFNKYLKKLAELDVTVNVNFWYC